MAINFLDIFLLVCIISAGVGGFRLGFVTRVASWIFMAAGVLGAMALLPVVLGWIDTVSTTTRLLLVILIVLAGALLGQMLGLFVGSKLASVVPQGPIRYVDKAFGALVGVAGVVVLTWLVLPAASNVPGVPAQQVRSSEVAQIIDDFQPYGFAPDTSQAFSRLVGTAGLPSVFDDLTSAPETGPPPADVALPQSVLDSVSASTVKVEGIACRRTQDGSGFAIGPNLVVTNAHVVAGERDTQILTPRGKSYDAKVVYFDAARDIALLDVPGYNATPLQMAKVNKGDVGAVFGHPGGQDALEIQPALVSDRIVAQGKDLYNEETTRRDVLVLSATLRQGDSGGAFVNTAGEVVGVAFAIAPDRADVAYALDITELQEALAVPRSGAVSTGDCLTE